MSEARVKERVRMPIDFVRLLVEPMAVKVVKQSLFHRFQISKVKPSLNRSASKMVSAIYVTSINQVRMERLTLSMCWKAPEEVACMEHHKMTRDPVEVSSGFSQMSSLSIRPNSYLMVARALTPRVQTWEQGLVAQSSLP